MHPIQLHLDQQILLQLPQIIVHHHQLIQHPLHHHLLYQHHHLHLQHLRHPQHLLRVIFQMDPNVKARVNAVNNHAVGRQLTGLLGFHIIIQYALLMVDLISLKKIKLATTGLTLQYYLQRCILANQQFSCFIFQNCIIFY